MHCRRIGKEAEKFVELVFKEGIENHDEYCYRNES